MELFLLFCLKYVIFYILKVSLLYIRLSRPLVAYR